MNTENKWTAAYNIFEHAGKNDNYNVLICLKDGKTLEYKGNNVIFNDDALGIIAESGALFFRLEFIASWSIERLNKEP